MKFLQGRDAGILDLNILVRCSFSGARSCSAPQITLEIGLLIFGAVKSRILLSSVIHLGIVYMIDILLTSWLIEYQMKCF